MERRDTMGQNHLLILGHDAGRQGAPMVLERFLTWLRERSPYPIEVVLHQGGPLLGRLAAMVPTRVLNPWLGSPRPVARAVRLILPTEIQDRLLSRRLRRRIGRGCFQTVWINSVAAWRLADALAPLRMPRVVHVHELDFLIGQLGLTPSRLARSGDHFIACSRAVQQGLVSHFGVDAESVSVVYSPVPTRSVEPCTADERLSHRQRLGAHGDDVLIVGCGVGQPHKGLDLVPRLLAGLYRHMGTSRGHVIWVGRSDSKVRGMLEADARRLGVADRLQFVGEVEDPVEVFRLADVFVLPSREDSFPLVCLEAAQCGLPTVCFDRAGGAPEFVEDDAGRVVPFLDVDAMAAAVAELALDPQLRARLGERARNKVEERFTVEKQGPKLLEVLTRAMTGEFGPASRSSGVARR